MVRPKFVGRGAAQYPPKDLRVKSRTGAGGRCTGGGGFEIKTVTHSVRRRRKKCVGTQPYISPMVSIVRGGTGIGQAEECKGTREQKCVSKNKPWKAPNLCCRVVLLLRIIPSKKSDRVQRKNLRPGNKIKETVNLVFSSQGTRVKSKEKVRVYGNWMPNSGPKNNTYGSRLY